MEYTLYKDKIKCNSCGTMIDKLKGGKCKCKGIEVQTVVRVIYGKIVDLC